MEQLIYVEYDTVWSFWVAHSEEIGSEDIEELQTLIFPFISK